MSEQKQPLISVIIPTFNRPGLLKEALQSLLNQTYHNFEAIIVNDCGVAVDDIVNEFHEKKLIYLFHDKRKGVSAARNTGIQHAKGHYIAYLDDDDIYYPNHLETLEKALHSGEYQVACSDSQDIAKTEENGQLIKQKLSIRELNPDPDAILVGNKMPPICLMHQATCLKEVGFFDETLDRYEDWDLLIRLSRKFKIVRVPKVTVEYTIAAHHVQTISLWRGFFLDPLQTIHLRYRDLAKNSPKILLKQEEEREKVRLAAWNGIENMPDEQLREMNPEVIMEKIALGSLQLTREDVRGARALCGYLAQRLPDKANLWLITAKLSRVMEDFPSANLFIQRALECQQTKEIKDEFLQICQANQKSKMIKKNTDRSILENTDSRLTDAYKQINSGKISVLSLDVFDTLLWRKTPNPHDLFILLGRLLAEQGWLIEAVPAEVFMKLRVLAEKVAWERKTIENRGLPVDVTLKEIYWSLSGVFKKITIEEMSQGKKGIINESDIDDLVATEVALDKQINQLDLNIVRLLCYAYHKGVRCIVVSDTYYEMSQLTDILDRNEPFYGKPLLSYIHTLYPSCEYGCSKGQGLFKKILEELHLPPERILHIGDDIMKDTIPAKKAGMSAVDYPKFTTELFEGISEEWPKTDTYQSDIKSRSSLLDSLQGDFGLTALRSKVLNDVTLNSMKKKETFFWEYGAAILAPVMVGFIHWIYERCESLGQSQVFCLMREGRLYDDLIKKYAPCYPHYSLEPKELWASRSYINQACIAYATVEELTAASNTRSSAPFTVESFCLYLGLNIDDIPKLIPLRYVRLTDEYMRMKVATILSGNEKTKAGILHVAHVKRQQFLKYLSKQIDLSSVNQITLVDVGWAGTIQGAIQTILHLSGFRINVHGLYLGTSEGTEKALLKGEIREGYLVKAAYPLGETRALRSGFFVLEQTATAGIKPLIGFDDSGNVLLGESTTPKNQIREVRIVRQGIDAFFNLILQYNKVGFISLKGSSTAITEQLRRILVRSTSLPIAYEAKQLGSWCYDHISGRENTQDKQLIGENEYYEQIIGDMIPSNIFKDWDVIWPAAYAAKINQASVKAAHAVIKGDVDYFSFLSHDESPVKITLDVGKGFGKTTRTISVRSNANRRFYVFEKMDSYHKAIRGIRLEVCCANSLIRVKTLRLIVSNKKNANRHELIFFESKEQEARIKCKAAKLIEPNTFFCDKDGGLILVYDFDISEIYALEIRLCYEIFPISVDSVT